MDMYGIQLEVKASTSFKASQILSQQDDIKKVIFWFIP